MFSKLDFMYNIVHWLKKFKHFFSSFIIQSYRKLNGVRITYLILLDYTVMAVKKIDIN